MTPEVLRAEGLKGKEAPSNIALWLSVVTLHFFLYYYSSLRKQVYYANRIVVVGLQNGSQIVSRSGAGVDCPVLLCLHFGSLGRWQQSHNSSAVAQNAQYYHITQFITQFITHYYSSLLTITLAVITHHYAPLHYQNWLRNMLIPREKTSITRPLRTSVEGGAGPPFHTLV